MDNPTKPRFSSEGTLNCPIPPGACAADRHGENSRYSSLMTRRPILFARAMLGGGLVLLGVAITAIVLRGFSDWALLIAPFAITVNAVIWMLRVNKYGSIFPSPRGAAHE
jgi:hypothetical protein